MLQMLQKWMTRASQTDPTVSGGCARSTVPVPTVIILWFYNIMRVYSTRNKSEYSNELYYIYSIEITFHWGRTNIFFYLYFGLVNIRMTVVFFSATLWRTGPNTLRLVIFHQMVRNQIIIRSQVNACNSSGYVMTGFWEYFGPDGILYRIEFTADDGGYRPQVFKMKRKRKPRKLSLNTIKRKNYGRMTRKRNSLRKPIGN